MKKAFFLLILFAAIAVGCCRQVELRHPQDAESVDQTVEQTEMPAKE